MRVAPRRPPNSGGSGHAQRSSHLKTTVARQRQTFAQVCRASPLSLTGRPSRRDGHHALTTRPGRYARGDQVIGPRLRRCIVHHVDCHMLWATVMWVNHTRRLQVLFVDPMLTLATLATASAQTLTVDGSNAPYLPIPLASPSYLPLWRGTAGVHGGDSWDELHDHLCQRPHSD